MATEKELIDAVRISLEADGELRHLKAELRFKVMKLMEGSHRSSDPKQLHSPQEVLVINELVREYLDWMGYKYTTNVLITECGLSKKPLDRAFISTNLCIHEKESIKKFPLLISLIESLKK